MAVRSPSHSSASAGGLLESESRSEIVTRKSTSAISSSYGYHTTTTELRHVMHEVKSRKTALECRDSHAAGDAAAELIRTVLKKESILTSVSHALIWTVPPRPQFLSVFD